MKSIMRQDGNTMQEYKVFFGPDDPWGADEPSVEERNRAVSRDNPKSPFSKITGNGTALRMFQELAFQALGRPDHLCRDRLVVLLGNGHEEKNELVTAFSKVVDLPLVKIDKAITSPDDLMSAIDDVLKSEGVPLVQVVRPNHFVLPLCVVFVTEVSDILEEVKPGLFHAIHDSNLSVITTESGKSANCHNVCWILADRRSGAGGAVGIMAETRRYSYLSVKSKGKWQEALNSDSTQPLDDFAEVVLCQILCEHGQTLCNEPRRLEALLLDACPSLHREIGVLMASLNAGAMSKKMENYHADMMQLLTHDRSMVQSWAEWALRSWSWVKLMCSLREHWHEKTY